MKRRKPVRKKNSKRREIAMHVLNGMIASPPFVNRTTVDKRKWAKVAYEFADALIEMETKT